MRLLQIYQWVCQWKNFENRLTFGEVMGKSLVFCFFLRHSVYVTQSHKVSPIFYSCNSMKRCNIMMTFGSLGWCISWKIDKIANNYSKPIFNNIIQLYCNTVPLSYMIDERKLLFYRKISLSKNIILKKTLMCLPILSSDYMFLCSKYGVRPTSTRHSIKRCRHASMASLSAYV